MDKVERQLELEIIIPVYRDNESLSLCLSHPHHKSLLPRMIVVLGEADEAARKICQRNGVACLQAPHRGRAKQMNFAAHHSGADLLLFLHADTQLPQNALSLLKKTITKGYLGGAFKRRFSHPSPFLECTCRLADWRGRAFGWFLGDQAIFLRKSAFEELNGYRELELFEDLDLSQRMNDLGKTCLISPGVISSGRRFSRRGAVKQTLYDFFLTTKYLTRNHI